MRTKQKSFGLFVVSITILALTIGTATFWDALGLGENKIPLALSVTLTFGVSIAGIVLGFNEIRNNKTKKLLVGLIGNILIIVFFALIVAFSYIGYK